MYEIYYGYTGKGNTLDECLEHIMKKYISNLWKISIKHNVFTILGRIERKLERVKYIDNLGREELLYSYDKEINSVEFLSTEVEDWLKKWERNIEYLNDEINRLRKENTKYIITFNLRFEDKVSSYDEFHMTTLNNFKDQLFQCANFDYNNIQLPDLNNIDTINEESFNIIYVKDNYKICISKIIKKYDVETFLFGVPIHIDEEGCIYSSGELTSGIKHSGKEFIEWINNFESKEELQKKAIKHWNFID